MFGNLAAMLLEAADVIARRDEEAADSDDTEYAHVVPQRVARSVPAWRSLEPADGSADEAQSSEYDDDSEASPPSAGAAGRRRGGKAAGPSPSSGGRGKPARGPLQHNEVEKRRRAYLASCYVELKAMLPEIAAKASNVAILQTAVEKIQFLGSAGSQLDAELAALRAQQRQLLAAHRTQRQAAAAAQPRQWEPQPPHHHPYGRQPTPRVQREHAPGFTVLLDASLSSSDDSHPDTDSHDSATEDSAVPEFGRRSLSPEAGLEMTYNYTLSSPIAPGKHQHQAALGKLGHYTALAQHADTGGGAIRRRSRTRPTRFQ